MSQPRMMDWLVLVYVSALVSAPHGLLLGILVGPAQLILDLFPYGLFLAALALVLLKNIIPGLRLDFGHTSARWLSLLFLMAALSLFGLTFHSTTWPPDPAALPGYGIYALCIVSVGYAVTAIFLGWPLGPQRSRGARPNT